MRVTTLSTGARAPQFSPDGKMIAFTGQYDGDEQVYVMPAEGGIPLQALDPLDMNLDAVFQYLTKDHA